MKVYLKDNLKDNLFNQSFGFYRLKTLTACSYR